MRYYVSLDPDPQAKPVVVDLVELPSGGLEARGDDRLVELDVAYLGAQLSVRVDGQIVDLTPEGAPPDLGVVASGHRSYIRVESDRLRAAEQAKKSSVGGGDRAAGYRLQFDRRWIVAWAGLIWQRFCNSKTTHSWGLLDQRTGLAACCLNVHAGMRRQFEQFESADVYVAGHFNGYGYIWLAEPYRTRNCNHQLIHIYIHN